MFAPLGYHSHFSQPNQLVAKLVDHYAIFQDDLTFKTNQPNLLIVIKDNLPVLINSNL